MAAIGIREKGMYGVKKIGIVVTRYRKRGSHNESQVCVDKFLC